MKCSTALAGLYLLLSTTVSVAAEESASGSLIAPLGDIDLTTVEDNGAGFRPQYSLNSIVAVVNDDVILATELEKAALAIEKQLNEKGTALPDKATLNREVLNKLVMESLQLQLAKTNGIVVEDSALNAEVKQLAEKNGVSLTEFRDVLEKEGYSYETFREDMRRQLTIMQVRRQMVASRIKVNDQEIDNLLATLKTSDQSGVEFRISHILIAIPEAASPEEIQATEARAQQTLSRLRSGADFAEIAVVSSDGQTALEGGDLGWRNIGQLPSMFLDTVQAMEVGSISDLIRTSGGFHIVKLADKRGDERHMVEQTRARHILIKTDEVNDEDDVLARIKQLEIRLRGGEDFATIALANSQDTLSAARGGDLDWVNKGDTVPEFEEAMNKLAPGELSPPVKSEFGWHLIEVQERRTHDSTEEFERSRVRSLIRSRKYEEELFLWMRRLRDESYVEYRIPES